jgi:ketosteroid isomerase-like protein
LLIPRLPGAPVAESDKIHQLIAAYVQSVDAADTQLWGQVWEDSRVISFINPLGRAQGWEQVKAFLTNVMGGMFTERKLVPRDIHVHVYRDAAWSEFNWHFTAKQRSDGAIVQTDGRETQIYRKLAGRWKLVHVHYSAAPAAKQ